MIKKIPIKGISRDPSGQLSADGMCAESLNVQLDMGEVAPAIRPKSVTDASGNTVNVEGDILFIHKGTGYENIVYREGTALHYTATIGAAGGGLVYSGLDNDEVINAIKSVGNTVIVSTDKDMYYILWRENAYHFLGHAIPAPAIHFRMGGLESLRSVPVAQDLHTANPNINEYPGFHREGEDAPVFPHESIGDVTSYGSSSKRYTFDQDFEKGYWSEYLDSVWGEIDRLLQEQARLGKAVFPMFVRYAVRLYDGTLYSQSIPVLLGAEISRFVDVKSAVGQSTININANGKEEAFVTIVGSTVALAYGYSIIMDAVRPASLFDGWEDIVTSVDVFVSSQLLPLQRNAAKFEMTYDSEVSITADVKMRFYLIDNFVIDPYYTVENQDKIVLNHQATYLAKSFTLDEFRRLPQDYNLELDTTSDYIMAQEALKETPQSMHYTKGGNLFNYNKRLLMTDSEQVLSTGYEFLHSVAWKTAAQVMSASSFRFVYYLRGENGENIVICRDENGNALIRRQSKAVVSGGTTQYYEVPYAWLAYPDSRCYKIEVYEVSGDNIMMETYRTNVFDQADVAYVFLGFGARVGHGHSVDVLPSGENRTYKMPSSLIVSKANNPFVFPVEERVTFQAGEVLNLAVPTLPLSEGQAGQFKLYAFTDEGVFALDVDSQGMLQTSHPVSRDILLNKDSLVGIEQGVFFAAARGLLLLQGSTVTKVSSLMDGHPTEIEDDTLVEQLSNRFLDFYPESQQQFHKFLADCRLAYDYANTRILLMNPAYKTMYVYKFDTQSWHRLNPEKGYPVRSLNAFPEAQVVMRSGTRQSVLDFSVLADADNADTLPGLIYTRDIALDSDDIYKTIKRLKVRGRFQDGHVKWQLQGSNDGINYTTIHSLRGPSWKRYRVVLVTILEPQERISYIEVDYETKFTDNIR